MTIWQPNKFSSANSSEPEVDILSAGSKGEVYFTRMFSYETYRKVKIHDDTINCMMIDGNILFTGGFDCTIKLTVLVECDLVFINFLNAHLSDGA